MLELVTKVYHWLGSGPGAASILVGLIAVVGALAGVITSYLVAGRTVYINSITAERSKWIDKLRSNIATHSGLLAELGFVTYSEVLAEIRGDVEAANQLLSILARVNHSASIIQLQLNPWNPIDQNLLSLINAIVIRSGTKPSLIDKADKLLILHSQWLLKAEWEKVKYEAHGWLYRWWHNNDAGKRLQDYSEWVAGEGSLTQVLREFHAEKARP